MANTTHGGESGYVKCWGNGRNWQLGYSDKEDRGGAVDTMGERFLCKGSSLQRRKTEGRGCSKNRRWNRRGRGSEPLAKPIHNPGAPSMTTIFAPRSCVLAKPRHIRNMMKKTCLALICLLFLSRCWDSSKRANHPTPSLWPYSDRTLFGPQAVVECSGEAPSLWSLDDRFTSNDPRISCDMPRFARNARSLTGKNSFLVYAAKRGRTCRF